MQTLGQPFIDKHFRRNFDSFRIAASLEVARRKKVILAHDHDGVCRANLAHFVLLMIQVVHFL